MESTSSVLQDWNEKEKKHAKEESHKSEKTLNFLCNPTKLTDSRRELLSLRITVRVLAKNLIKQMPVSINGRNQRRK